MASRARPSSLVGTFLNLLLCATAVGATQWTVTKYYVITESTSVYSTYTSESWAQYTFTETLALKDDVTPTATAAISIATTTNAYETALEVVQIYLPPGEVPLADLVTSTTFSLSYDQAYTYYYQPIEYTAPSSCPTQFTVSTYTAVTIPTEVAAKYTYTSADTSVMTYNDGGRYTYVSAYLPTAVLAPTGDLKSDFIYSYYVADCRNPTASGGAYYGPGGGYGGSHSDGSSAFHCSEYYGCYLVVWVIVIAVLIPCLFLFGFLENYLWFRRLMLGKGTLRFGTVSWIVMSLVVLCFTRPVSARSKEDQERLRTQWKAIPAGQRIKLWFKWGFRHRYPVELLGVHPTYKNGNPPPLHMQPQMQQGGPGDVNNPQTGGFVYYTGEDGKMYQQWYQGQQMPQQGPYSHTQSPPPGQFTPGQQGSTVTYYPPQQSRQQNGPPQGYPPPGYPPQSFSPSTSPPPPQGYPPQGFAQQGYPPQGYPPQGYPPQNYASPGSQQSYVPPQSGTPGPQMVSASPQSPYAQASMNDRAPQVSPSPAQEMPHAPPASPPQELWTAPTTSEGPGQTHDAPAAGVPSGANPREPHLPGDGGVRPAGN